MDKHSTTPPQSQTSLTIERIARKVSGRIKVDSASYKLVSSLLQPYLPENKSWSPSAIQSYHLSHKGYRVEHPPILDSLLQLEKDVEDSVFTRNVSLVLSARPDLSIQDKSIVCNAEIAQCDCGKFFVKRMHNHIRCKRGCDGD